MQKGRLCKGVLGREEGVKQVGSENEQENEQNGGAWSEREERYEHKNRVKSQGKSQLFLMPSLNLTPKHLT